jgi:hypothetical protein
MVTMVTRLVLLVLVIASAAHAEGIALEAYTGDRPADAGRLLGPVLDELAKNKISSGDTVARTFESAVSRPARTVQGLPSDFAQQVDAGFKAWFGGRFDESIKTLVPLIDLAHANSGAFAKDPALREPLRKAMIGLALAQQKSGDPAAMKATFAELVRGYPELTLSRGTYGPEASQAFEDTKREVGASGVGKLTIKVVDKGGTVFVDEAYRAAGTQTLQVPPGEYRVVVLANGEPSRTHYVTVHAGGESTVVVDATFDQTIRTSGWSGFSFATEADRDAHEAAYAAQVANALGAQSVAVVGIDQVKGHAAVVGSLISLETGREIRRASVALDPDPPNERLKALARFLTGEAPAAGLDVLVGGRGGAMAGGAVTHHDDGEATTTDRRWGGYRWIAGTLAVGGLATGAVLLALDGRCKDTPMPGHNCNNLYENSPGQWIALAGGAVFAGVAAYLFATQHASAPSKTAFVAPDAHGAIAGVAMAW